MLNKMRAHRVDLRLSHQDLARLTGLTQQYVSQLERGLQPREPQHVSVIAQALGVSEDALSAELLFSGR